MDYYDTDVAVLKTEDLANEGTQCNIGKRKYITHKNTNGCLVSL